MAYVMPLGWGHPPHQFMMHRGRATWLRTWAAQVARRRGSKRAIGSGGAGAIYVGDGNNRITTTTGWVDSISTGRETDVITIGSGHANSISSGGGNDRLNLENGRANYIATGDGSDIVRLGSEGGSFVSLGRGDDVIFVTPAVPEWGTQILCGEGIDRLNLSAFTTAVRIDLSLSGQWQNIGATENSDTPATGYVAVTSIENLVGGRAADHVTGNGDGNRLDGGAGNDKLLGGGGKDRLTGGSGADDFVYRSISETGRTAGTRDVITDFRRGLDDIDLRAIDANTGLRGNQEFEFIGRRAFSDTAGELRFANGVVSGDVNGDGRADFSIAVSGVNRMAEGDFIL